MYINIIAIKYDRFYKKDMRKVLWEIQSVVDWIIIPMPSATYFPASISSVGRIYILTPFTWDLAM